MSPAFWPIWRQPTQPRAAGGLQDEPPSTDSVHHLGISRRNSAVVLTARPSRHLSDHDHDRDRDRDRRARSDHRRASAAASPSPTNLRLKTISQQPAYPNVSFESPAESSAAANFETFPSFAAEEGQSSQPPPRQRAKGYYIAANRPRRLPAARLWNPANSTPRFHERSRTRRPSTPPLPTVPLEHPALAPSAHVGDLGAGNYPLLSLSEQRQIRNSVDTRASLQIERTGTNHRRVSLPSSVRASHDGKRPLHRPSSTTDQTGDLSPDRNSLAQGHELGSPSSKVKGKERAVMAFQHDDATRAHSRDLERGPDVMNPRISNVSGIDGIGSAISSSNSSIMGEDVQPDAGEEWGPQHPCYPHLNPHVPLESAEYSTTRIIRVKRDWLIAGDLAPTFSNLYPEILDPAGVSEQEFRRIVEKLNAELIPIFDPFGFRNVMDSVLGLVTGWLWDDFGLTAAKSRMKALEKWIEAWNQNMEKTMASEEGNIAPKLISLRQTGYMTLDIQIPDPEIAPAPIAATGGGDARPALPAEPRPAIVA